MSLLFNFPNCRLHNCFVGLFFVHVLIDFGVFSSIKFVTYYVCYLFAVTYYVHFMFRHVCSSLFFDDVYDQTKIIESEAARRAPDLFERPRASFLGRSAAPPTSLRDPRRYP